MKLITQLWHKLSYLKFVQCEKCSIKFSIECIYIEYSQRALYTVPVVILTSVKMCQKNKITILNQIHLGTHL